MRRQADLDRFDAPGLSGLFGASVVHWIADWLVRGASAAGATPRLMSCAVPFQMDTYWPSQHVPNCRLIKEPG